MHRTSFAAVALVVAACGAPQGPSPGAPAVKTSAPDAAPVAVEARGGEDLGRCDGLGFVPFVGRPLVRPGEPLPESGGYLHWKDLPDQARVLGPGVVATDDVRPARLTVQVTGAGVIRRLTCG